MIVQDVYERYRIMPALQLHQLRVAAVSKMICENATREFDGESLVLAGLFHDMANIIKSDLTTFPEFLEPLGAAHWGLVKGEFIAHYGTNEHNAALRIAKEIGLAPKVIALIEGVGFSKLGDIRKSADYERKILEYGDLRVGPHGVIPMGARIEEARLRYAGKHPDVPHGADEFERLRASAFDIELQIFEDCAIAPEDITEQSVQPLLSELRELAVP